MKIFISYARAQRPKIEALQALLDRGGYEAWFDRDISGGEDWWRSIVRSIQSCDVYIFALTPDSTSSAACRAEYAYATELNKPILPVLLADAELPVGKLRATQYVDLRSFKDADAILDLNRALVRLSERIAANEFPPPVPYPRDPDFPFPPDPLETIRTQIEKITTLPETDVLQIVYQLQQISRQSATTSVEARKLLEAIANDRRVPFGVVELARSALTQIPRKRQRSFRWRPLRLLALTVGLVVIAAVILIFAFPSVDPPPPTPAPALELELIPGSAASDQVDINAVQLSPAAAASLALGEQVTISFAYRIDVPSGVRIYVRPVTGDLLTSGYGASGSPLYRGEGTGNANFTVNNPASVQRVRFQVWDANQTTLFEEFFIAVDYRFE